MTATADPPAPAAGLPHEEALAHAPAPATPTGNPAVIGVPTFLVGSIALGMVLTGFVPGTAVGASIAIIMTATGIGQVIAATWAARLGESAVAAVFGTFAGFWLSYAALVLGLLHNWYLIPPREVAHVQEIFLTSWLVVIVVLTLVTLRLPFAFTLLFVLVDLALFFVLLGTAQASVGTVKVGGWFVFSFVAVGAYLFADAMSGATGGRPLPMGRAVIT